MTDKITLKKRYEVLQNAYRAEKSPMRRKEIEIEGLKLRADLGLSPIPQIEKRQLRALEIAEAKR